MNTIRNKKENKLPFGWGHFPIGTVFKFQVSSFEKEETEATVRAVIKNGPDSYVVETNLPCELTDYRCINIDYVTQIIKRGKGIAVLHRRKEENENEIHADYIRMYFSNSPLKSKSQYYYNDHTVHRLLTCIVLKYANDSMCVDGDILFALMKKRGFFPDDEKYNVWEPKVKTVQKKKLHRAVKQLLNKALVNHEKAQKEQDELYNDMDRDSVHDEHEDLEDQQDTGSCYSPDDHPWSSADFVHPLDDHG